MLIAAYWPQAFLESLLRVSAVSPERQLRGLLELSLQGTGWALLYLLIRFVLLPQRTPDFANRSVSVVHALVAASFAYLSLQADIFAGLGGPSTPAQVCGERVVLPPLPVGGGPPLARPPPPHIPIEARFSAPRPPPLFHPALPRPSFLR